MSEPTALPAPDSFATLLRRLRLAAGLTQEALAARAGLSDRAISALERGVNRQPHLETVQLLASALALAPQQRDLFLAAARPQNARAPGTLVPHVGASSDKRPSTELDGDVAPAETLTFLLTDVEGSTDLWERHEAAMRAALVRHDALFDEQLARHGGRRIKERGEGDAIFAVFADPNAAVAAALAIQRVLLAEPWPDQTSLRVRMALHTGMALLHEGDYYGPVVNRCARIRDLGYGGQVLLAEATATLAGKRLPEGASLLELGWHHLRGIGEPQAVYQLRHPALPAEFPPLRSPQAPKHNLPGALSRLVGREGELGAVLATLEAGRLVTLVGAGGVGKTRLALAVAEELVGAYPDGVWLVELAGLREGALVVGAAAGALGVREEPSRDLLVTLTGQLREKRLLLVLDNCEHLLAACAELVEALLRSCAGLRVLATSREGLGVAGERLYRVPSLPVPDPLALPALAELGQVAAVRLFVERAGARRPDFALGSQNAALVAGICRRLEGIPLAIELAAGRVGGLPLEVIAERLDRSMGLLTGGPRTAPSRQQTLRGALDWSWALLGEPERILLRRLSVFAGGWVLGAAETVCMGAGLERWVEADLLGALVSKSLVLLEERAGLEGRYRLLEPVRQYAAEQLAAAGEETMARGRHLVWCVALAEEAEPELTRAGQEAWLERLEAEHDNLRAALAWSLGDGDAELGLRLAGSLGRFWDMRSYLGEGRDWLAGALARGAGGSPAARARALNGAGILAWRQSDYGRATALYEGALALRRSLGDTEGIARSLNNLGMVAERQGDYVRARALYEESLVLRRALGDRWGTANSLNNLGNATSTQGDYAGAEALYEESLALRREVGDRWGIATSLNNLANVASWRGDYVRARALYEESLALARALGERRGIATSLHNLGTMALARGDHARARVLCEESLTLFRELGERWGVAASSADLGHVARMRGDDAEAGARYEECLTVARDLGDRLLVALALDGFALLAGARGQPHRGARLWGAADALRQALGTPRLPSGQAEYVGAIVALRAVLGEEAWATAWETGQAMTLEEAMALALKPAIDG